MHLNFAPNKEYNPGKLIQLLMQNVNTLTEEMHGMKSMSNSEALAVAVVQFKPQSSLILHE